MELKSADIGLSLQKARQNIEGIKRLSALSGLSHCCIGALERRQAQLENAYYGRSSGNLGILPVVIVGGAIAMGVGSLISAVWWHYRNTEVELRKQENIAYAMENNIDPATFCPSNPESPTDKLINTVKTAIVIGAVAMGVVILSKSNLLKGVFKH